MIDALLQQNLSRGITRRQARRGSGSSATDKLSFRLEHGDVPKSTTLALDAFFRAQDEETTASHDTWLPARLVIP